MLMFMGFSVPGGAYGGGKSCIDFFAGRRPSLKMNRRDLLLLASIFNDVSPP